MESGENGVERVMNYFKILQLKEDGFSISKISKKLSLSRNTVKKYLKMTPVEMEDWVATLKTREKKLDPYRETILTWLKEHPDLTGAQIHDWLDERCDYKMASENTVRNFVNEVSVCLGTSEVLAAGTLKEQNGYVIKHKRVVRLMCEMNLSAKVRRKKSSI